MSTNQNETDLPGCGVAVAVAYVIWGFGGALMFVLLGRAAYLQGQQLNDGGPWLLVPWTVIVACALLGWWQYRRFRRQRRSRQAVPEPVPSVLLEAIQVVEDEERRYRGEL